MCCETVKFWRNTVTQIRNVQIGVADTEVYPVRMDRVALTLPSHPTSTLGYVVDGGDGSFGCIRMAANGPAVILTLELHGDLVRRSWHARASVAGQVQAVEVVELGYCNDPKRQPVNSPDQSQFVRPAISP